MFTVFRRKNGGQNRCLMNSMFIIVDEIYHTEKLFHKLILPKQITEIVFCNNSKCKKAPHFSVVLNCINNVKSPFSRKFLLLCRDCHYNMHYSNCHVGSHSRHLETNSLSTSAPEITGKNSIKSTSDAPSRTSPFLLGFFIFTRLLHISRISIMMHTKY